MQTNFFPIDIDSDSFQCQTVPYSAERLDELRESHNSSYSFFRYGELIVVSPHDADGEQLGEYKTFDAHADTALAGSLLRHLLFQEFRRNIKGVVPTSFSPLEFLSRKHDHDPIRKLLPEELHEVIGFPRVISIAVEQIEVDGKPRHGFLISYRNRWQLALTLENLKKEDYPIVGSEVLGVEPLGGLQDVLAPRESFLGVVRKLNASTVTVETNDGLVERSLEQLAIRRTHRQLGTLLQAKIGRTKTDAVFKAIRSQSEKRAKPDLMIKEIREVARWIGKLEFRNGDNFSARLSKNTNLAATPFRLERTKLIFDYTPGTATDRPLSGLLRHGPFDSAKFDPKSPHFLVMFRGNNRGAMTEFAGRLIDGLPDSSFFKKGLRDLFRLQEIKHTLTVVPGESPQDYEQAFDNAVAQNSGSKFDLVLVECSGDSKRFPPADNPYLRIKSRAMALGIPVQCVRDTHVRAKGDHPNTLGPLALQMYAKIGGQPWRLPASQTVDQELVVGLGSSLRRRNAWQNAEQSRVVGLTTFFLGDGRYVLGENLPAVEYDQYFDRLLEYLEKTITQLSEDYGWKEGQTVRLVFHVFKPLKNIEVDVVDELVKRFSKFNIVYAFVTVSLRHPWLMYQQDGNGRVQASERCANLVLNDHSCLVQLKGNKDRTNWKHRPPQPVKIQIHEKSTYDDLQYIAQQVMDFSCLSWRGFFPSELPVTIRYSKLMADLTSKLSQIDGWNSAAIDQHFRRKKWFL
jgi:hypothetical protein